MRSNMGELVTIVVPVFNRASVVGRALRSILEQTYENWEAMVVDDGSTDHSTQVIEQFTVKDSPINLIRHPQKKGAQAARNTGIFAATGNWVAFLDSDDVWLRDSLAQRLQLAVEGRFQVVHSECYVALPGSAELRRYGLPPLQGGVYRQLLRKSGLTFPSLLVSKECIRHIGYLDETVIAYQEWDTAIRLAKYFQFGFVRVPTFIYDCRLTDSMSKNLVRDAKGYEQVFTKHFWSIFRLLGPMGLVRHYQMAAHLYFEAGDEDNAWRCLMRARLLWPFRPRAILRRLQHLLQSGL